MYNNNDNNTKIIFMVLSTVILVKEHIARVHLVHTMKSETGADSYRPLDQEARL